MAREKTQSVTHKGVRASLRYGFSLADYLIVLTALFFALFVIVLSFVQNMPEAQRWLSRWRIKRATIRFTRILQQDPPLGTSLSTLFQKQFHPINRVALPDFKKPFLIVTFAGCEDCRAGKVQEWAETLGNWETWRKEISSLLVFQEKAEKVKEMAERGKWKVAAIVDEDDKIFKVLNVIFTPRVYGFVDDKLVWLQREPHMSVVSILENFLKVTQGEEKAKTLLNAWSQELRENLWGKDIAAMAQGGKK